MGFTVQVHRHRQGLGTPELLGRIMRLHKANFAGLTSPGQQSEMKLILAGAWPPLKPLPVFKYETAEYRATIDFDRKRGEWVCRKTSLPSNQVQELRGGLREITMALPHGESEMFTEGAEQAEQELEKDAHRRLQAMHDWRENFENGARYFELREYLSETQQAELDDSLRLSLTARQLQFNSKNVANVFDDLSIAGGRFATLIEFAQRNKAKQGAKPPALSEGAVLEAERGMDHEEQSLRTTSPEFRPILSSDDSFVKDQETREASASADEFPALSIKDVFPEQDQAPVAEQAVHTSSQRFDIEMTEIADADSPSLAEDPQREGRPQQGEHPHQEERRSAAFAKFAERIRMVQSSANRIESWSSRLPALELSTFKVALFALPLLFAAVAFAVGLAVGRGPLGKRLQDAPKSIPAVDAKSPALPNQAYESHSRTTAPPVARSDDSAGANRLSEAPPSEENSKESTRGSEYLAGARPPESHSSSTIEAKPSAKPELDSERSAEIGPTVRIVSPPPGSGLARSSKAAGAIGKEPRSSSAYRLTSTIGAPPHVPGPSTVLVSVPRRGGHPFRVNFPKKTIAATSSFAMASQLSVLVAPEPGPVAQESARLEAGELVSFVWPRYARPADRYGSAETIRVRATIGQLGQVQEVKFLSGSASLLPPTMRAIRQWHYKPTLLDKRPVQAQQDVTIEFRPPLYSSRVSTPHPAHN